MNYTIETGEYQRRGMHLLVQVLKQIVSIFHLQGEKNQTNLLKWHIVLVINTLLLLL